MIHKFSLQDNPFLRIKDGSKTIEIRLLDEKRKRVKLLDTILFSNKNLGSLEKTVIGLRYFRTFEELIDYYSITEFGPTNKDEILSGLFTYYEKEMEAKYGVVAIILPH